MDATRLKAVHVASAWVFAGFPEPFIASHRSGPRAANVACSAQRHVFHIFRLDRRYSPRARVESSPWTDQLTVPVITLDSLIAKFEEPKYIKIDVEGSEGIVLAGLSTLPQLLSFEFNRYFLETPYAQSGAVCAPIRMPLQFRHRRTAPAGTLPMGRD
jgi:hypothetical protein